MKAYMQAEVETIHRLTSRIENDLIPETIAEVNAQLEKTQKEQAEKMIEAFRQVNQSIASFSERMEYFATDISTT